MKNFNSNLLVNFATKIFFVGFLSIGVTPIKTCLAQSNIVPDNTLGTEASRVTPNVNNPDEIPSELIEAGAQRGVNLFHSLQEFNVSEGRGAYFVVPNDTIQNVLTRVTGNNPSSINGILGMISNRSFDPSNANLFLINPNGIIFGENASLDVNASFVGTTANAVGFGEVGLFSATNPQAPSQLLTVNPSAFLFNQIKAQASIESRSVAAAGENFLGITWRGLRVGDGNSLLLLGGDISIDGGGEFGDGGAEFRGISAIGGRVELGGLVGEGTVGLNQDGNNLSLSFPSDVTKGNVFLSNYAGVGVVADNGGSIAVNAENLEITRSFLVAGIGRGLGSDNSKAGNIDINVTQGINLDVSVIANEVLPRAKGQGGDINISTSSLFAQNGAQVSTVISGEGKGGNLTVNAQDIQLIGGSRNQNGRFGSGLVTSAIPGSKGDAGNLTVNTNNLLVQDGARVSTSTSGEGKGGNLTVNTNNLLVQDGAVVSTITYGEGKAGNLTVNAQDIQLIGISQNAQFGSGLFASASRGSKGDAGELTVNTNNLLVQDGALMNASTYGEGKGGDLTVNAQDIQLIGRNQNDQFGSGLFVSANTGSKGDAGELTVNTNTLELKNGGQINARSSGKGIAGDIKIDVKNNFNADNGQVLTESLQSSGGNVDITVEKNIILRNNSNIRATLSRTAGSGGNITLTANAIVALEDSDILAFAPEGRGGNITFDTRAFFNDSLFRPRPQISEPLIEEELNRLDNNNRVDLNATGSISSGTISGQTDPSFLQDSLTELKENPIDSEALIASSCVVRSNKQNGTFFITGTSALPYRPGDPVPSKYSAIGVQSIPNHTSIRKRSRKWKIGDPILEATGVYRLENGQSVIARECGN